MNKFSIIDESNEIINESFKDSLLKIIEIIKRKIKEILGIGYKSINDKINKIDNRITNNEFDIISIKIHDLDNPLFDKMTDLVEDLLNNKNHNKYTKDNVKELYENICTYGKDLTEITSNDKRKIHINVRQGISQYLEDNKKLANTIKDGIDILDKYTDKIKSLVIRYDVSASDEYRESAMDYNYYVRHATMMLEESVNIFYKVLRIVNSNVNTIISNSDEIYEKFNNESFIGIYTKEDGSIEVLTLSKSELEAIKESRLENLD